MGNPAGVKRDFSGLEKRRLRAARLLEKGLSEAEVARRVGVHRQSVNRWELPTADWQGARTGRESDTPLEAGRVAPVKKNAEKEGRTIAFVDESGLSERAHRCRTWAPRGQTPVLQYRFNWKTLSVAVRITWSTFYFKLFPGSIKAPQVVEFLTHLMRHISGPLLVIWDGLPPHRSRLVRDFVLHQQGRLQLERLLAYAPELNPTEYVFGHLKQHQLANLCQKNLWELSDSGRRALRRMRRRPVLVRAFWQQSELS